MEIAYTERTGEPFTGRERERLISFLKEQELDYDQMITYSVILEAEDKIVATGSCHGNVLKCIAVAPEYQGCNLLATIMVNLAAHLCEQGIAHYFCFTKPKNKEIFCKMGLYPVEETKDVLLLENRRNGLERYLEQLKGETKEAMERKAPNLQGDGIGAIVANCNPFTLGHRYLIEQAAKECRWVHLFVLSEEQKFLTSGERYRLVQEGVRDLSNVILHQTSDYLISPAVFPTYFMKEKAKAYNINCILDICIFGRRIGKALGITRRLVGDEPFCDVTGQYNQYLKKYLPEFGIQVTEIRRIKKRGLPVSASSVRDAWEKNELQNVRNMLPGFVWEYLQKKER